MLGALFLVGLGLSVGGVDAEAALLGEDLVDVGVAAPTLGVAVDAEVLGDAGLVGVGVQAGDPAQQRTGAEAATPQEPARWQDPAVVGPPLALAALAPFARRIWRLLAAGAGIGLFSRIQPDHEVDHEVRAQMMDLVTSDPGVDISTIQTRTGVAWGTAVYHLRRLESSGHLVSTKSGNRRCYWVRGSQEAAVRDALLALRPENARAIAKAVVAHPDATQKEVCQVAGVGNPVASKFLKRMEAASLVEVRQDARCRRYRPTAQMAIALNASPSRPF